MPYLSVILPAFNEAENLALFVPQIIQTLEQDWSGTQEIIIVNDGSSDRTTEVFAELCQNTPASIQLKLLNFSRNFGKEAAVSAGLKASQGELTVIMDADGQHPLELLSQMHDLIQAGNDVAAAVQVNRSKESWFKRIAKHYFYKLVADTQHFQIPANAGDFRMMKRKVVDVLLQLNERQRLMKGLYAWAGFKVVFLPFEAKERLAGTSKFSFSRLLDLALTGITAFSTRPLRWVSHIGLLISLGAILYGFYIVGDTLITGNRLAGWPTLAAGIMFLSGVQLICLGVIGEYIGNIYQEVKQRPLYVIDSIQSNTSDQDA